MAAPKNIGQARIVNADAPYVQSVMLHRNFFVISPATPNRCQLATCHPAQHHSSSIPSRPLKTSFQQGRR